MTTKTRSSPASKGAASPPHFPAPGHDHGRCQSDALGHAERECAVRGEKFTPLRREVLQALLASHKPLGAYDVIELLARDRARPSPISVYRALDFLTAQGFVHRIESRNAYLACAHYHDAQTVVAFMICDRCGAAGEIPAAALAEGLDSAVRAAGFTPKQPVLEIAGTCAHCRDAA